MTTTTLSYGPFISRAQAKAQGLKRYFTGKPCASGHVSARATCNSKCLTCKNPAGNAITTQVCKFCGKSFRNKRASMYCSEKCGTKAWRKENQDHVKTYGQTWRKENQDHVKEYQKTYAVDYKKYYQTRKVKLQSDPAFAAKRKQTNKAANQKWFASNREQINKRVRVWANDRYNNNLGYKLKINLRNRINEVLRAQLAGKSWSSSSLKALGCSVDELISYLEAQFQPGMTWDNWAHDGWHIDHIRPCASFDLTDPEQQKQCFHYTNLQPLWAADNLAKSDKWEAA